MRPSLVHEIMSHPAITVPWDRSILEASGLMELHGIRRLPVIDDEGLVAGIVSLGDVREAMSVYQTANPYAPDSDDVLLAVDEVMTTPAITVGADDLLLDVVRLLLEHKIGGIPVVDAGGHPVGMVTESDVFRVIIEQWEQEQ